MFRLQRGREREHPTSNMAVPSCDRLSHRNVAFVITGDYYGSKSIVFGTLFGIAIEQRKIPWSGENSGTG